MQREHPGYFTISHSGITYGIWSRGILRDGKKTWDFQVLHRRDNGDGVPISVNLRVIDALHLLSNCPDYADMHPKTFLKRILGR